MAVDQPVLVAAVHVSVELRQLLVVTLQFLKQFFLNINMLAMEDNKAVGKNVTWKNRYGKEYSSR